MVIERAPGSWLQEAHLRRRIREWPRPADRRPRFVELGAGRGALSRLLLAAGYTGVGVDLSQKACARNLFINREAVRAGRYRVVCGSWSDIELREPVDVFVSSMVLEHLEEAEVVRYLLSCRAHLAAGGRIVTLVPAGRRYWGIEDIIAGHRRRYERRDLEELASVTGLQVESLAGLTYPLSNMLLPLSNLLVSRAEGYRRDQGMSERTRASGVREVRFKTVFPRWTAPLLSAAALLPFDLLQRIFHRSRRSLVLYCELGLARAAGKSAAMVDGARAS